MVKKCLRQTSRRGAYKVYTDKNRYSIGKYASCHGVAVSVRGWKNTYPNLNESTVRGFKKRYEVKLKEASRKNVSPKKKLANKMRGHPTLLGQKLHTLVQKFLRATRYKDGVVNTQTAPATAKALVKCNAIQCNAIASRNGRKILTSLRFLWKEANFSLP